jgi:hypothetical protein
MEPNQTPSLVHPPRQHDDPAGPSACPVCGSGMVPLRGLLRCSLCGFVFCEGCEGLPSLE